MGQVRFRGDQPHYIPVAGRVVEPDELVELPDAVVQDSAWAESLWEVLGSGRKAFDPAEHTVAEVNAHLEKADADERARVLAAERDGQARKGILDNAEGA